MVIEEAVDSSFPLLPRFTLPLRPIYLFEEERLSCCNSYFISGRKGALQAVQIQSSRSHHSSRQRSPINHALPGLGRPSMYLKYRADTPLQQKMQIGHHLVCAKSHSCCRRQLQIQTAIRSIEHMLFSKLRKEGCAPFQQHMPACIRSGDRTHHGLLALLTLTPAG